MLNPTPLATDEQAAMQADQQAVENQDQPAMEVIAIEDHPIHGSFDIEVPKGFSDPDVQKYVDGLDLDLLLGMPQKEGKDNKDLGVTNVEQLKEWENSVGAGKRGGKWFTHDSLEGGTPTIAYGSKLTQEEYDTGKMKIGDKLVNWRSGITEEQAQARLNQDAGSAKQVALAALTKANMADDPNKVSALTSLIYNVGSGAWAKSNAKKYLETGRIEDFMHEAFSPEVGFVKVNGEVSRGLVRRRAAEAQLFGEGNIGQGGGFGSMMSEVLSKLNPISSAQASERTPQDQQMAQAVQDANTTLGELGGVNVPSKPTPPGLEDMGGGPAGTPMENVGKFFSNLFIGEANAGGVGDLGNVTVPNKPKLRQEIASSPPPKPPSNKEVTKEEQTYWDIINSTPAIAGILDIYHQALDIIPGERVFSEKTLSDNGLKFLKEHAKKSIPKGTLIIDYNNTGGGGVAVVGHKAGIPDLREADNEIKFFLGKANYIKVGNNVVVADEYDYNYNLELRDQNIFSKFSQIYDRVKDYKEGKIGKFAIIDSILERFQSKPGEGPSVRINLGTKEELGIKEKDFNKLPTLEEYSKRQTVNPRNKDWKLTR